MARGIRLSWATSRYVLGRDDGQRIRLQVEAAEGLSAKIFAYRLLPADPYGGVQGYFDHVCSPTDLSDFPADGPIAGHAPEWFRLSFIDVHVRSVQEVADFLEQVRIDIGRLIATLNRMDTLQPGSEVVIGGDPDPEQPSSSESSEDPDQPSESLGEVQTISRDGTYEQGVAPGVAWSHVNDGAGSPVGDSDSAGASFSRVVLAPGTSSQLLLVQGFDFSDIPRSAVIEGIEASIWVRDPNWTVSPTACPRLRYVGLQHPDLGAALVAAEDTCLPGPDWSSLEYGSSSDTWTLNGLRGRHLRDGALGFAVILANDGLTEVTAEVDGVSLTVHYRETGNP